MLNITKSLTIAAVAAMTLAAAAPAQADNGRIAAGVVGGLAAGAIIGSAVANSDRPHYVRQRECWIERRDFEDRYGRLHVRKVRVCN